ncbi:MAG: 50S ribosomal protein L2 [Patescibacteria group bacterium]|jgi:large subunit ribosomal protein L2
MGITKYKPVTKGRRISSVDDFADITKFSPEKALTVCLRRKGGRNNQGKITVPHQGGGAKRRYRMVDFKREKFDAEAIVLAIEYDPNRSGRVALIQYADGLKSYVLAPHGLKVNDKIISSHKKQDIKPGNRMPIKFIPAGLMVYEMELVPGQGGIAVRSAGNGAVVMSAEDDFVQVKMPSSEMRNIPNECLVTVGQMSNIDWRNIRWGKAGRMRLRGIKPSVRGKAMNPVDHPHGGGEGHNPIGMKYPKTKSGKHALGVKTRNPKKKSSRYIVRRRVK